MKSMHKDKYVKEKVYGGWDLELGRLMCACFTT